ncbi:MAG: hypothetical protein ABIP14_17040, partial [Blastocatellia bacterium]
TVKDGANTAIETEDNMNNTNTNTGAGRFFIMLGGIFGGLAFLALLGAWLTQLTGGTILGINQQHFFNDARTRTL